VKRGLGGSALLGVICLALIPACAKKHPTSRPVVIEDLLPFGTPVCFPTGMTNPSTEVGSERPTMSPLRTQDNVPEVFRAPTTQPTEFSEEERAWIDGHKDELLTPPAAPAGPR
jgi:hypothetical protein